MRKKMLMLAVIGVLGVLGWVFTQQEHLADFMQQYVENGEITTLKAKYTADQIMEAHRQDLLVDSQHTYRDSGLKYHPYMLMEVKYFQDKKPREGVVLWSLVDGEMVINTASWDKTHGFEDAINADANRHDFKLMQAISKNKGPASLEQLQKELHLEKETLLTWVESAASKHLVVQKNNELQLHFQDPKILVQPETKMTELFVKKPYQHAQRVSGAYSASQIQKIAKAAFGEEFLVRSSNEVFLPVYSIEVLNPDGSTFVSYWNALTGQKLAPRYSLRK